MKAVIIGCGVKLSQFSKSKVIIQYFFDIKRKKA